METVNFIKCRNSPTFGVVTPFLLGHLKLASSHCFLKKEKKNSAFMWTHVSFPSF